MTNSYKSYSTNLEKMEIRTKHEERRQHVELLEKIAQREYNRQLIQRWNEMEDAKEGNWK